MVKTLLASVTAVAATMLLAVGASAGATVQHYNLSMPQQCYPGKFGSTFCVASTGEENVVQTPSGNLSAEINVSSSFVASLNGTVLATGTDSFQEHVLYTNEFTVLQEGAIHETSVATSDGVTCTFSADIHVTGLDLATGIGHIQYDNVSFVCV